MAIYEQWLAHRRLSLEEGRQTSLEQIGRVFKKDIFSSLRHLTIYEIPPRNCWTSSARWKSAARWRWSACSIPVRCSSSRWRTPRPTPEASL
ncbi:hypothetical protein ACNFG0_08215 [Pseudomonas sp. NY15372]|uniref:hypothetical protein n=1 Tax=Pseudomonas sp. NY15372 TaxID=3400356 RepID=UPI003A88CF55